MLWAAGKKLSREQHRKVIDRNLKRDELTDGSQQEKMWRRWFALRHMSLEMAVISSSSDRLDVRMWPRCLIERLTHRGLPRKIKWRVEFTGCDVLENFELCFVSIIAQMVLISKFGTGVEHIPESKWRGSKESKYICTVPTIGKVTWLLAYCTCDSWSACGRTIGRFTLYAVITCQSRYFLNGWHR